MMWVYPVTCDVTEEAETGVKGHWLQLLPPDALHLLQPAEFLCVDLLGFLVILGSFDLHKSFLKFGPCLSAAMGGSGNTSFSSGFSFTIDLKCLLITELILGRRGLKSKTPITLFDLRPFCVF